MPRESMMNPHAHHNVEKIGRGDYALKNQEILSEVNIDHRLSKHNLSWAPNIKGQHGETPQRELNKMLESVRGDREKVIEVLSEWKSVSAARK